MVDDEPAKSRVESLLQAAVQTVQWTYSLFWQLCPQQGSLVWSDGYYNGAIKTRKTVQPTEDSVEESTLQRSQQLRELYESLVAGETSLQPRRPSASLSPEDLTESEWFYLMCVSFSFPPGVGLPGKAYVERQHIWLTRANEADSRLFSRTILAKSAKIQTVLCIPLLDGVVELGTTEKIEENIEVIELVKSFFFSECENPNPNPPLSEQSTSNPPAGLYYPAEEVYSEPQNSRAEPILQLHASSSQDIIIRPVASQDHSSNHFSMHHSEEDTQYYSQTVSSILENQSNRQWSKYSSSSSAFCKWTATATSSSHRHSLLLDDTDTSQLALKYILLTVPLLHTGTITPQLDDLNGSHMMAERRRREKLNERFLVLRSMVPFITKIDKASILGDTIEYLKQLKRRIRELESNGGMKEMKKMRKSSSGALMVEVSIIESDALVEIQCSQKQGLLLDVMQALQGLGIQFTTVQSSINAGIFTAHFRAKVKENAKGWKPSIIEVKRVINQIIQHH